jgi:peptidoglycan/LPS O-acetylase OafA/YrhL
VDIFFVLSGFLIAKSIFFHLAQGKQIEYFHIIVNRVLRLWPPLFVVILFELLTDRSDPFFHLLYKTPLFIQNFSVSENVLNFAHFWSTAVDVQVILGRQKASFHWSVVLPLLLLALHKAKMLSFYSLFALLVFSALINASIYNDRVNIWTIAQQVHIVSGIPQDYHQYFIDKYSWSLPVSQSDYGVGEVTKDAIYKSNH